MGVPVHDDRKHFEFLLLDAFQAGLSGHHLNKRDAFRAPSRISIRRAWRGSRRAASRASADPGIVRNRQKIEATIRNARAFRAVQDAFGSFDAYVWRFTDGVTRRNAWKTRRGVLPAPANPTP
jgi:DNA-3-methyladenine glycosylase I